MVADLPCLCHIFSCDVLHCFSCSSSRCPSYEKDQSDMKQKRQDNSDDNNHNSITSSTPNATTMATTSTVREINNRDDKITRDAKTHTHIHQTGTISPMKRTQKKNTSEHTPNEWRKK